jgi:hypothetical protein
MNYLNFNNSRFSMQNSYSTLPSSTNQPVSPKLGAGEAFVSSSSTASTNLTEVCYYLSRTIGSIASLSVDARPLYTPKASYSMLNDIRTLLPEVVEDYSLANTN